MAEIVQSIVGFELGPDVPASGSSYGYLASSATNGYVAADIKTGSKRSGTYGYNSKATVNTDALHATVLLTPNTALPSDEWELRVRYYFRIVTLPSANNLAISFTGTGVTSFVVRLQMDTSGQLRVVPAFVGSTTTAYQGTFSTNTWYQVRLRCYGFNQGGVADATHTSAYALDVLSEDGTSTLATFSETITLGNNMPTVWPAIFAMGQITGGTSCTREIDYDDFWCYAATGAADTAAMEWPQGTKVEIYAPTANGSTNDFTRSGVDTGANWSQVSDIPRLTGVSATNVASATAGHIDKYQHAALATQTDRVYHIQNVCWLLDTTTPQDLIIDSDTYSVVTVDGGSARYALAHKIYTNATAIEAPAFDAMQFGIKKTVAGGTTLTSGQQFLEILTGPPNIITGDLPDPTAGHEEDFSVASSLAYTDDSGFLRTEDLPDPAIGHESDFATSPTFVLSNQGGDLNVPETWRINRIDVGYRDEGKS